MYQNLKPMNIPLAEVNAKVKKTGKSPALPSGIKPSVKTFNYRQDSFVIKKNPFSSKFFNKLLQLEEDFYCHQLTVEVLDTLVQSYSQLVEYYDYNKDPIKAYFLEKMQFTLSRPQIVKMMMRGQSQKISPEKPLEITLSNQPFDDYESGKRLATQLSDSQIENSVIKGYLQETPSFTQGSKITFPKTSQFAEEDSKILQRKKNKERAQTIQLQVEIESQLAMKKENVTVMVQEYQQKQEQYEEMRKEEDRKQQEKINEKILSRRNSVDKFQLKGMRKDSSTPALRTESQTDIRNRNHSAHRLAAMEQDSILENQFSTTYINSQLLL